MGLSKPIFEGKKTAFTLAEVLITLTIIGIIAALTIPTLMRRYEDHRYAAGVKKAYAILNNAFVQTYAEKGPTEGWLNHSFSMYTNEHQKEFWIDSGFLSHIKTRKQGPNIGVFGTHYDMLGKNTAATGNGIGGINIQALLEDGSTMLFALTQYYRYTNGAFIWGFIFVDVNGAKKPNRIGVDTFEFGLTTNKIIPMGDAAPYGAHCDRTTGNGYGCTKYVILNGNLDYRYKDVTIPSVYN